MNSPSSTASHVRNIAGEGGGGAERGRGARISDAPYKISLDVSPSFEFPTAAIVFEISIDGYLVETVRFEPDSPPKSYIYSATEARPKQVVASYPKGGPKAK